MTNADTLTRRRLRAAPAALLSSLPDLGRFMLIARAEGLVLERLGVAETVELLPDGRLKLGGAEQDSELDVALIDSMVADRSVKMKDRALPRVELLDRDGALLFSVVSLGGLESFDPWIAPFEGDADAAPPKASAPDAEQAATEEDDLSQDVGGRLLTRLAETGVETVIEIRRPGVTQRFRGVVESMRPVMGYANIITKTFHLHLRGGAVAEWRAEAAEGETTLLAVAPDGQELGLRISTPAGFDADA